MSVDSTTVRNVSKSPTKNGSTMFLRNQTAQPASSKSRISARQQQNFRNGNRPGGYRRSSHSISNENKFFATGVGVVIAWGALILTLGAAIVGFMVASHSTVNSYADCVVTGKDRTANADGASEMRVYTQNCGTFTLRDDWLRGNFTSADLYGSLQEGEVYDFEASGFRIGILSSFPNIISIKQG